LMRAGKLRARMRNLSPTGEKHSTTCRYFRTLSMKKSHRFSAVQGLTLAHIGAQLEDLREHVAHVRTQLVHLRDTSTG
jgi:hypothetical protein